MRITLTREQAAVAVNVLNEALRRDPSAIQALFAHRVPCNSALAQDPTIQVAQEGEAVPGGRSHSSWSLGMMGLLNGLFGIDERGWGHICGRWDTESGTLLGFELTDSAPTR